MAYRVIRPFKDKNFKEHIYHVGDIYPAKGSKPGKARIESLATGENERHEIFIEKIENEK